MIFPGLGMTGSSVTSANASVRRLTGSGFRRLRQPATGNQGLQVGRAAAETGPEIDHSVVQYVRRTRTCLCG